MSQFLIRLLFALLFAVPLSRASPTCLSSHDFEYTADRGNRSDTDQMLGAWKEHDYQAHLLCESGMLADGRVIRVKTELNAGKVGFGTGWQSANPYGVVLFKLKNVNGQNLLDSTAGQITIDSGYQSQMICGAGTAGSYWQFNKGMAIVNTLAGGTKIVGYAFKNDADKNELLAGQNIFSIDGSMLGCNLEVVVELPVPTTGNLEFEVQVQIERDTMESEYNAGLTLADTGTELQISTNQSTADQMRNGTGGSNVIMTMSKGLICKATETAVSSSEITINGISAWDPANGGNSFTYTVSRSTIASCGSLYWDPKMAAFGGYQYVSTSTAGPMMLPSFVTLVMTAVAVMIGMQL